MIINRLQEVKEEIEKYMDRGWWANVGDTATFHPKKVANRVVVEMKGGEVQEIPETLERIVISQKTLPDGIRVVGNVSDISAERERLGEKISGPGPLFSDMG